MKVIHISFGGPMRVLKVGKFVFRFELHPYCGPMICDKNDKPTDDQPNGKSPFWEAFQAWRDQGERVSEGGKCIFKIFKQPKEKIKHLGGRHYLIIPSKRMTKSEWKELAVVSDKSARGQELLLKSRSQDEHPENHNGPCLCKLCMSYGNIL